MLTQGVLWEPLRAYKLFRRKQNGTLGSLFINRRADIPVGVWLTAQNFPSSGYAVRPGWHVMPAPVAPHLSDRGREWWVVEIDNYTWFERPAAQGGRWLLAQRLRVIEPVAGD
jgi:hypothetical protein